DDVDLRVVGGLVRRIGRHGLADLVEQRHDAAVLPVREEVVTLERGTAVTREIELVTPAAAPYQKVLLAAGGLRRCKDAVPGFLLGRRLLRRRHGNRRAPQGRQNTERRDLPGHHLLRSITIPSSCSGVRGSSRDPLGNLFACSRYDTTSIY